MIKTTGYAAHHAGAKLAPFEFEHRELGAHDILIEILYCGVCHSDVHQTRGEWGANIFPMVPGHEIVGSVSRVGAAVTRYKVGDFVGVGCMVDSCRECVSCHENLEQFCEEGFTATYNSLEREQGIPTRGGYANYIVVRDEFVLRIASNVDLARTAPLLCAGITTYSPMRQWNVGVGQKVAVIGLGGLGHMAVKLAAAFGAEVTLFTRSSAKQEDALRLGASKVVVSTDEAAMAAVQNQFDFILDTVSAPHDLNAHLRTLKRDGVMVMVGMSPDSMPVSPENLVMGRRILAGSLIGGIAETQEMLDFCGKHKITSDIELINIQDINHAYERMDKADVKYRFVINMGSLQTDKP
ncbi:MAG: hydroxyacid dehydrogenase [Gammaproteobacteria bacterium]|jgi:uncharacterized zinc-type alcohol dehydrogenase-like protein|nr:hydroxyacid dehydrogenase [Gammaproteobacteria bacterium]